MRQPRHVKQFVKSLTKIITSSPWRSYSGCILLVDQVAQQTGVTLTPEARERMADEVAHVSMRCRPESKEDKLITPEHMRARLAWQTGRGGVS